MHKLSLLVVFLVQLCTGTANSGSDCFGVVCPENAPRCQRIQLTSINRQKIVTTVQCFTESGEALKKEDTVMDNSQGAIFYKFEQQLRTPSITTFYKKLITQHTNSSSTVAIMNPGCFKTTCDDLAPECKNIQETDVDLVDAVHCTTIYSEITKPETHLNSNGEHIGIDKELNQTISTSYHQKKGKTLVLVKGSRNSGAEREETVKRY